MELLDDNRRGAIFCEEAYARGKMLDHSEWDGELPRKITPSDIDAVFDNWEKKLFCELSRHCSMWTELSSGQRRSYEGLARMGEASQSLCVLCKHSVDDGLIRTVSDIESFAVMLSIGEKIHMPSPFEGSRWKGFVRLWYQDPGRVFSVCAKRI